MSPPTPSCACSARSWPRLPFAGDEKAPGLGGGDVIRKFYLDPAPLTTDCFLDPKDIHTTYVAQGKCASWFVVEGEEDPSYQPRCWTNRDLTRFNFGYPMYQQMPEWYLETLLRELELYGVANE